jgi:hypothetical protein
MSKKYIPVEIDKIVTGSSSNLNKNIIFFLTTLSLILIVYIIFHNDSCDNKNFTQLSNETYSNNSDAINTNISELNYGNSTKPSENITETKNQTTEDNIYSPEDNKNYPNPEILRINKFSPETDTKCLDGTPYAVYYHPGYDSGSKNIIINFEAYFWCGGKSDQEVINSCASRTKLFYGSSNYFKNEYSYEYSFMGGLEHKNKYFYNWHRILFPYCDGCGFQGHHSEPLTSSDGQKIYFRGYKNTVEGIKFIFKKVKIEEVETVVVSGCSSGGSSALFWVQYIEEYVRAKNPTANVYAISNAGFFLDLIDVNTNQPAYSNYLKHMYSLVSKEGYAINKDCLNDFKNEPHKCLIPEYLIKYVKVPVLVFQALYDGFQLVQMMGEKCAENLYSLVNCKNESQKKTRNFFGTIRKKYLKVLLNKKEICQFGVLLVFSIVSVTD